MISGQKWQKNYPFLFKENMVAEKKLRENETRICFKDYLSMILDGIFLF